MASDDDNEPNEHPLRTAQKKIAELDYRIRELEDWREAVSKMLEENWQH